MKNKTNEISCQSLFVFPVALELLIKDKNKQNYFWDVYPFIAQADRAGKKNDWYRERKSPLIIICLSCASYNITFF